MTIEDAIRNGLKGHDDLVDDVVKSVTASGKFIDLKDGGYVDKNKFDTLETKYNDINTKYTTINDDFSKSKQTAETLQQQLNLANETSTKNLTAEKKKFTTKLKDFGIDKAINDLGIKDPITAAGIKSFIDRSKINVDDDYNLVGLDDQITTIKETYKDSFNTPTSVSTGISNPTSNTVEHKKQYNSFADIKQLSPDEIVADIANITQQLSTFK
jgi:hypothetical protein